MKGGAIASGPPDMKPSANFSLNDKLAKEITGKEIGERYTVTVTGIPGMKSTHWSFTTGR